jgi:hypothetical protein
VWTLRRALVALRELEPVLPQASATEPVPAWERALVLARERALARERFAR